MTPERSLEDLEAEVYTARELHGDDQAQVRDVLADARKRVSEATYQRALVLARDSVLLSVEECVSGALAMEWDPQPRPEFSLATIEAAVADQERGSSSSDQKDGAGSVKIGPTLSASDGSTSTSTSSPA